MRARVGAAEADVRLRAEAVAQAAASASTPNGLRAGAARSEAPALDALDGIRLEVDEVVRGVEDVRDSTG